MYGEIITIGNELTSGRTPDLNSWYAAGRLAASGLGVTRITSVGDDYEMVADALRRSLSSSQFVIVTGGLGSTVDDMTCEIVAKTLHRPLCKNPQMFRRIQYHVERRGIEMTASFEKMAWMPEGSRMLHPQGNACGFYMMEQGVHLYFLPGVPDQMRYLMDKFVIPEILGLFKTLPVMRQRILKVFGLNEPRIAEMFKQIEGQTGNVVLGFYPQFPENHITMSFRSKDEPAVTKELNRVERLIRGLFGPYIFASGSQRLEEVVGQALLDREQTLSVAESCTGGLIEHMLTEVPGSSQYFLGGVVAYSNPSKMDLLRVQPETLDTHGAVSDEVVKEMARGVRIRFKSHIGLAVSGVAGPGGGSRAKPVGTVHIGLADTHQVHSEKYRFWGNRDQVKSSAASMALDWVRRYLHGHPFLPGV